MVQPVAGRRRRPDWVVRAAGPGDVELRDTGWVVASCRPDSPRSSRASARCAGKQQPVAHLVYSDGLVAVSVFIENVGSAPHPTGLSQQGGINIFVRQFDDHLVTVLGEVPAADGPADRRRR